MKDIGAIDYTCYNCDETFEALGKRVLYCSDYCSQEAEYIRYHRRKLRDGTANQADVEEALAIIQGRLEHDGASRTRKLQLRKLKEFRQLVFERDHWTCQICKSNKATGIDHIRDDHLGLDFTGNVNDPSNLRAVCDPCHRAKTLTTRWRPTIKQVMAIQLKRREWDLRVHADVPVHECDDDVTWDWRAVQKARLAACNDSVLLQQPTSAPRIQR